MKKSYIAIMREIEKMKSDGLDKNTIESVLKAKYNESSIERIYTEAQWERDEELEEIDEISEEKVKNKNKEAGIVSLIIFIVFVVLFSTCFFDGCGSEPDNRTYWEKEGIEKGAYYHSQEYVKKLLKAPGSAKFPRYNERFVSDSGYIENQYTITCYVDAQNSFGAFIRVNYISVVKYLGNDKFMNVKTELLE